MCVINDGVCFSHFLIKGKSCNIELFVGVVESSQWRVFCSDEEH